MRVIVDLPSIAWRAYFSGKDTEKGYEAQDGKWVNGAEYAFGKCAESLYELMQTLDVAPRHLILVDEGEKPRALRSRIYPDYKAQRNDKNFDICVEFNLAMKQIKDTFAKLGSQIIKQDGLEADDVIGWLAKNLDGPRMIVSNDGDLAVLQDLQGVSTFIGGKLNHNPFGDFPAKYITLYKALVGDSSDNYKGAYKFGNTSFAKVYAWGGNKVLDVLQDFASEARDDKRQIKFKNLDSIIDAGDLSEMPPLQKLLDSQTEIKTCWKLARLYDDAVRQNKLQWVKGFCHPIEAFDQTFFYEPLVEFMAHSLLVTADNLDQAKAILEETRNATEFHALDIETDTPEESKVFVADKAEGLDKDPMVDVIGSYLVGMGLTCGKNQNVWLYFSVAHADTNNVASEEVKDIVKGLNKPLKIHNVNFELPVLFNEWGFYLENAIDTRLMLHYVDEDKSTGLKSASSDIFGYDQVSYAETTQGKGMSEISGAQVLSYGLDDVRMTSALYTYCDLFMGLEKTRDAFNACEMGAAYLIADSYVKGVRLDKSELRKQEAESLKTFEEAKSKFDSLLIENQWEGTVIPQPEPTPQYVKQAFRIITGKSLTTQIRKLEKLADLIEYEYGEQGIAAGVRQLDKGNAFPLDHAVKTKFVPNPEFKWNSSKQNCQLLYGVLNLPVRLRNDATEKMREEQGDNALGNPKTDEDAIGLALANDCKDNPDLKDKLETILEIKKQQTLQSLFFKPYRYIAHWKTGKVHPSAKQCGTVTRRYSYSDPNVQQLPKEQGGLRKLFIPHCKDGVIVSFDFSGQESRLQAGFSQDENMLACYIGENKKDLHSMTGFNIAQAERQPFNTYEEFDSGVKNADHALHKIAVKYRKTGKAVNFATDYGAGATKLSIMLRVTVDEAQIYIDAKTKALARLLQWKEVDVRNFVHQAGYVNTLLGARRHFPKINFALDKWEIGRMERQAVNAIIQGSAAEQTKLVMRAVWERKVKHWDKMYGDKVQFYFPVHDELVFSMHKDLAPILVPEIHALMTTPFGCVPVESSIGIGRSFGTLEELGSVPDVKLIEKTINLLFQD